MPAVTENVALRMHLKPRSQVDEGRPTPHTAEIAATAGSGLREETNDRGALRAQVHSVRLPPPPTGAGTKRRGPRKGSGNHQLSARTETRGVGQPHWGHRDHPPRPASTTAATAGRIEEEVELQGWRGATQSRWPHAAVAAGSGQAAENTLRNCPTGQMAHREIAHAADDDSLRAAAARTAAALARKTSADCPEDTGGLPNLEGPPKSQRAGRGADRGKSRGRAPSPWLAANVLTTLPWAE